MNTPEKNKQTDEIGDTLEDGSEVNRAIEQQGDDATVGILRDTDAAKHDKSSDDKQELQDE